MSNDNAMSQQPVFGSLEHIHRFIIPDREIAIWELVENIYPPGDLATAYREAADVIDMSSLKSDPRLDPYWVAVKEAEDSIREWAQGRGFVVEPIGMREECDE